jgi:hypothetical protein
MNTVTIEIAGDPVKLRANTLTIDDSIDERSVARFAVLDDEGTLEPSKGEPVIVRESGMVVFHGFVEDATTSLVVTGPRLVHQITAVDGHYLADKRLASISYQNQSVQDIVADLHNRYLAVEGVALGQVDSGPTVELIVFPWVTVADALSELAELAGYWWYVTPTGTTGGLEPGGNVTFDGVPVTFDGQPVSYGDDPGTVVASDDPGFSLEFRSRDAFDAPSGVTSADVMRNPQPQLHREAPDYRNVQYIRNVEDRTDVLTERHRGDGETSTFTVAWEIAESPTVRVNGTPRSVGVRGVDEGRQWYFQKGDRTISQDSSADRLTNSDLLEISYIGLFATVVRSEDRDAIVDRQTVQGGSGKVEHTTMARRLDSRAAAFDMAAAKLANYTQIGRTFTFTSRSPVRPGMLLPVDMPQFGLDTQMLVSNVTAFDESGVELRWQITAVEGPHQETWSRFFARMFDVPDLLVWRENLSESDVVTRLLEFDKVWEEQEGPPNIFTEVYPSSGLMPSESLLPMFAFEDRIRHVEVYWEAPQFLALQARKELTQRSGVDTDEIKSVVYLAPHEANGPITSVVWFGGWQADWRRGTGIEVGRVTLNDRKTSAEAWQIDRTDTKWSS